MEIDCGTGVQKEINHGDIALTGGDYEGCAVLLFNWHNQFNCHQLVSTNESYSVNILAGSNAVVTTPAKTNFTKMIDLSA